ncbi:MAG: ATPase, partial [Pseudomonadota bacterium]
RHDKIQPDEKIMTYLLKEKYPEQNNMYANYHAPFLIDQVLSICDYEGLERKLTPELVDRAWENLFLNE